MIHVAPATLILLLLNALVSIYAFGERGTLIQRWSFQPQRILEDGQWYRLLTAGFIHTGWWHLLFNIITLYFFGPEIERILGTLKFVLLYLGAEMAAHCLTLYLHRDTPGYAAVGASGAISGVIFGYCLFYPFNKLYVFFIPVGIPAVIFAVLFVVLSISAAQQEGSGILGRVAHEAHLGGAVGGLLLTMLLEPRVVAHFLGQLGGLL
jgi:membrane associated rhomboid family serine protease